MLQDLGWLKRVNLLNSSKEVINPSTEEKQTAIEELLSSGNVRTRITNSHGKDAQLSAFGLLKTVTETILIDARWTTSYINANFTSTIDNNGSWNIVETNGLQLNSGSGSSSGITLEHNMHTHYQSGRGMLFKMSTILGDTGIAGNIRQWGLFDSNNGVFIRLNGTQYEFVLLSNGVETVVPASSWNTPVTPDTNGHLWYIQFEWLGVGNYYVYYDEQIVYTHNYIGQHPTLSMESPDLPLALKNYNTTNTTDVYFKTGCAAVVMEGGSIISGVDDDGMIRQIAVNSEGRMLVSQEPPTPPAETTPVNEYAQGDVSTTDDLDYIIPNGQTLVIQFFAAGSAVDAVSGNVVELWYDADGTKTSMVLIDAIYCSGSSNQHTLNTEYEGDGTAQIVMRRRRLGGGAKEIFGNFRGYIS